MNSLVFSWKDSGRFVFSLFIFALLTTVISAQITDQMVRGQNDTLRVTGSYSNIQWQLSSDNLAWYNIPLATTNEYVYKTTAPAFIRAQLTNSDNSQTYSNVHQVIFEPKTYLKTIKSSGGQGYAENNGKATKGITIREDRNSSGTLNLTAYSDNWVNKDASLAWYLYHTAGQYDISIILNISANKIQQFEFSSTDINNLGCTNAKSIISVKGTGTDDTIVIHNVTIPKTGFCKYLLTPITDPASSVKVVGFLFNSITSSSADIHATNYLSSPSVHLGSWRSTSNSVPSGQKYDWCYMEVLVPSDGDQTSTYYMTLGILSGYMGIQNCSDTQKNIIFSMWDDGSTDTNPTLDKYHRSGAIDSDPEVSISRFGNEGTGTKSFINGEKWKVDVPVRFLTNARLEEYNDTLKNIKGEDSIVVRQNTLVSAWYNPGPSVGWKYISTLRLPNEIKYFDSWYSFIEDFSPWNGQLKRYAYYYNGFAHKQSSTPTDPSLWVNFNQVSFSHTDGNVGQRRDYEQGKSPVKTDAFYMSSGGYGEVPVQKTNTLTIQTNKTVVDTIDLSRFLSRVDAAVLKEKLHNDSIKVASKNIIPTSTWTVDSFTSESTGGTANSVIDGNESTYWQPSAGSLPQFIILNMKEIKNVTGILVKQGLGNENHIKSVEVWGTTNVLYKLIQAVNVPDYDDVYIKLSSPYSMKRLKLIIKSTQTGGTSFKINEIDVTVDATTGIDNPSVLTKENSAISVYPNPVKSALNIRSIIDINNASISILTLTGKEIYTKQIGNIKASQITSITNLDLPKQPYIVQIKQAKKLVGTKTIYKE